MLQKGRRNADVGQSDEYKYPLRQLLLIRSLKTMSEADNNFEVTQIMASRIDDGGDQWFLVQWGCTWIPRSALVEGPIKTAWMASTKIQTPVTIPEEQHETSDDETGVKRAK